MDPQLVWKGKDEQDQENLAVPAVPIYIQEKIHPQAIVEDFILVPRLEPGNQMMGQGDMRPVWRVIGFSRQPSCGCAARTNSYVLPVLSMVCRVGLQRLCDSPGSGFLPSQE